MFSVNSGVDNLPALADGCTNMDAAATLEMPASSSLGYRITKENARLFAQRSWAARRARSAKREEEAKAGRESTPQSERLSKQISQIEAQMSKTSDGSELSKLASAHDKLFRAWQVLTGTPNPGSRRGRQDRPRPPEVHCSPIPTPQETTH
jgi:hypothetical protein